MRTGSWQHYTAATVVALTLAIAPALAHHGWSSYDETKPLTVDGTITASTYANPHGTMTFEAEGKTWEVVLAPTSRMQARGLTEAMVAKGTKARVVGYQHKERASEMRAERITVADKTVELR